MDFAMGTRSQFYSRTVFFVLAVSVFGCQRSVTQSVMTVEESDEPNLGIDIWPTQVASVAELERLGMFCRMELVPAWPAKNRRGD